MRQIVFLVLIAATALGAPAYAQGGMTHTTGMTHTPGREHPGVSASQPTQGGQAAFATVSEIVKILQADSTTDWTRVDLEALRQHLIDMDAVTMRAHVTQVQVPGGITMQITGDAAVAAAIRRLVGSHAPMLQASSGWRTSTAPITGGLRFTVAATDPADATAVARIRGLGFIGLMVQSDHHTRHHLMIARGATAHAHEM